LDDARNANSTPDFAHDNDMQAAESEGDIQVGARHSSGRVRKRTEVDRRCECDTLITAEEKQAGTRVMELWSAKPVAVRRAGCVGLVSTYLSAKFGNGSAFSSTARL
jgi:hypothetical protein